MKFPFHPKHTTHKHGGVITRVDRIEHTTARPLDGRSRDNWFYIGAVEWSDGGKSDPIEIMPWHTCHDGSMESRQEVLDLSEALADYLYENGKWCDRKSKHEGWYANERPAKKRRAA